jgi:hypothetical protein
MASTGTALTTATHPTPQEIVSAALEDPAVKEAIHRGTRNARVKKSAPIPGHVWDALFDYASECTEDPDAAIADVKSKVHRCRSTERTAFLKWAIKIVRKQPTFRPSFAAIQRLDLDVLKAFRDGERAYDSSQPFDTHVTPTTTFVKLKFQNKDFAWKLPNDQTVLFNGIEYTWPAAVEKMWPCRLKKVGNSLQVVTRINGIDYHMARLLMGLRDDEVLGYHNNDPLDYTCENYFVIGNDTSPHFAREQDKFDNNVMKYGTCWNMEAVFDRNANCVPDKATAVAPRDAGSASDDGDEPDLRSGYFKGRKGRIIEIADSENKVDHKTDKKVAESGYKVEGLAETSKDFDARLTKGPRLTPGSLRLLCSECGTLKNTTGNRNGLYTLDCGHQRRR